MAHRNSALTPHRTNEMLTVTATRSGSEADELHAKVIELGNTVEHLRYENALLTAVNDAPSAVIRTASDSFSKPANEVITALNHEKSTLEEFLRAEQQKCAQFLANAELNLRKTSQLKHETQDFKIKLAQSEKECEELTQSNRNLMGELQTCSQNVHHLRSENESLHFQLKQVEQNVHVQRRSFVMSPKGRRTSVLSKMSQSEEEGIGAELEELGFFDHDHNESFLTDDVQSTQNLLDERSRDFSSGQFGNATVDAQEEFLRLVCPSPLYFAS